MNVHVWDASPDQDDIREGLDRELTRRWTKTAREVKRSILTHDALGIGEKAPQVAQPTGDKAEMFRRWLNERLAVGIGGYDGSWLEPFVNRASERGAGAALQDAYDPDEPRDPEGRWTELKKRAVPALKHRETGKLLVGRRGLSHNDIVTPEDDSSKYISGFYDPVEKRFLPHDEFPFDSTDLMTEMQRQRWMEKHRPDLLGDAQANVAFLLPSGPAPSSKACHGATVAHLAGICEDVSQRAHDSVADGLLARRRPSQIARLVDHAMGHGLRRSRALAEHAVTQAYSQATLDGMEARGVTHVGTLSERKRIRDAFDHGVLFDAEISLDDFDPDEPRDEQGRWTPAKTVTAYKQFEKRGDELHPLFISTKSAVPQGRWLRATFDPTKGYAPRPGWHAGVEPIAPHLRRHTTGKISPSRVWAEVELPADKDYQLEAEASGTHDIRGRVPEGGFYRFKTNKMQGGAWMIGGALKVNRVLSDPEVAHLLRKAGHSEREIAGEMHDADDDDDDETIIERPDGTRVKVVRYGEGWAVIAMDAPRKNPQPKHPRSGRFAKAHVVARELRRSKRTGQFRKQGLSAEEQRKEELAEMRFGRLKGKLDVLTAGDDRVCDVCDGISANGPYTISEARSLIPAHPNCRCVFVAAGTMKDALLDYNYDPSEPRDPLGMWTKTEGFVAYHGSGHEFSQFGIEHVGEGEGSQVYGHGLYLAEEPKVAEGYKKEGLPTGMDALRFPGGKMLFQADMPDEEAVALQMAAQSKDMSVQGGIELTQKLLAEHANPSGDTRTARWEKWRDESRKRSLAILQTWKAQGAEPVIPTGNLYQVKIHATPDEFLDWDKPLSQQSKLVQDYVKNRDLGAAFKKRAESATPPVQYDPSGEQMMRGFIGMGPKGAAALRAAGIKGVRYLDAGSRLTGDSKGMVDNYGTREKALEVAQTRLKQASFGDIGYWQKRVDELSKRPTSNYVIVEPAIIEITHHNGKPLTPAQAKDALVHLLADFDPDEPRDERGRWTSSGSVTPSLVHTGGEEFVSPSVETGLTFDGAKAALSSPRQAAMLKVSDEIDGALGLKETAKSVIGAWADGAENSVLATLPQASWDEIKLSAAMKGYVGDQKAVLAFKQDDNGDAFMYEMHAKGALDDIHHRLLNDGLAFHTLAPTADGADVYVADLDGKATEAIQRAAKDFHANATYQRGHAEFIGTQLEEGTDRAIRDDARRNYEGVIQQSPVSGGAEVWGRNRDRWSQALTGVRAKELVGRETDDLDEGPPPAIAAGEADVDLLTQAFRSRQAWGAEVRKRAEAQFEQDGYPKRHLEVLSGVNSNVLAGANYNTLAQYSPSTGKIQVFAEVLPRNAEPGSANTVEGTVAHEIMHAKTDWWMKQNPAIERKMKDKIGLHSDLMDKPLVLKTSTGRRATPRELMLSDGVTPYSRSIWTSWIINQNESKTRLIPFDLPFGETISEMRAMERETGKLPGDMAWKELYHDIEAEWKRGIEKDLNPRTHKSVGELAS